jgi:hypothetical protein
MSHDIAAGETVTEAETAGGAETVRVQVWLREPAPHGARKRQRTVANRVIELAAQGAVDEYDIKTWAPATPARRVEGGVRPECETVRTLERWAAENDRELPGFVICDQHSAYEGEDRAEVRRPLICLAVYQDGELSRVAPCSADEGVETVSECLERLETDGRYLTP